MNPSPLSADDFPKFFEELWGQDRNPFPWQQDFAHRISDGKVPKYVAVPTGSGKTACLDAAVFALAAQAARPPSERTQGRRIFFIVNRRVIVDEAYDRARKLCEKLKAAPAGSVSERVSKALRSLSGELDAQPLECVQLRGGIYRDKTWARSLTQPTIICSTVDQAGSRLLFRGYGVPPQARPIHAALVAQDSLLIIDEAHISRPFIQTLEWVGRYRQHRPSGCETVQLPFQFIQMTATPPANVLDDEKVSLTRADYEHKILGPRLNKPKAIRLVTEAKAKGKARLDHMAKRLTEEAINILAEDRPRSIAIMVNRVAVARSIEKELEKKYSGSVSLFIGRMRPIDRNAVTDEIKGKLKTGAPETAVTEKPIIVVSTQCLEVGADLDFDVIITEAASLDALRQRFGRLNRGGRDIPAKGLIVFPGDQDVTDPIYGDAILSTGKWLATIAREDVVDFGINTMTEALKEFRSSAGEETLASMLAPTLDAPIMLPAYLDSWAQTNPPPAVEPDVSLFLHGPVNEVTDIQICWRGDLPTNHQEGEWENILSLCPPVAAECLPIPIHVFRQWLNSQGTFSDFSSDTAEISTLPPKAEDSKNGRSVNALVWRGPGESFFVNAFGELRPGDTVVLRAQDGGWAGLGYVPNAPSDPQTRIDITLDARRVRLIDVAEQATAAARRRAVLRIHPALWPAPEKGTAADELKELSQDLEQDWNDREIKSLLGRLLDDENPGWTIEGDQREIIRHLAKTGSRLEVEPYPSGDGFVLTARDHLNREPDGETDGTDTDSEALLASGQPKSLADHTQEVVNEVERSLKVLPLSSWHSTLIAATRMHDWGKADPRFQALLRGASPFAALASETLLAKSASMNSSVADRRMARKRAELPDGFRHEMLSVQMATSSVAATELPREHMQRILSLHLIATHHGYARPFAPVIEDESPMAVGLPFKNQILSVSELERREYHAHALDSEIAERFWQVTRHFGWWGSALIETILRLADQRASANSQTEKKP